MSLVSLVIERVVDALTAQRIIKELSTQPFPNQAILRAACQRRDYARADLGEYLLTDLARSTETLINAYAADDVRKAAKAKKSTRKTGRKIIR